MSARLVVFLILAVLTLAGLGSHVRTDDGPRKPVAVSVVSNLGLCPR